MKGVVLDDGTVLYPDCGSSYANLCMYSNSQNCTPKRTVLLHINLKNKTQCYFNAFVMCMIEYFFSTPLHYFLVSRVFLKMPNGLSMSMALICSRNLL